MQLAKLIEVAPSFIEGRGCFAGVDLLPGIVVPVPSHRTNLDSQFNVESSVGPLRPYNPFCYLNHANPPNANLFESDEGGELFLEILSLIPRGHEITIYYGEEWDEEDCSD